MEAANHHIYQLLTKRSSMMRDYIQDRYGARLAPRHIWCGVSVEDTKAKIRIAHLRAAPARTRFLSLEPLIGPVGKLDLAGIHWVIVGGESGLGARLMDPKWVREIRDQCLRLNVPFFFKQWGGLRPKSGGRILDGRQWDDFPSRRPC